MRKGEPIIKFFNMATKKMETGYYMDIVRFTDYAGNQGEGKLLHSNNGRPLILVDKEAIWAWSVDEVLETNIWN